jgi:hypothetical protein
MLEIRNSVAVITGGAMGMVKNGPVLDRNGGKVVLGMWRRRN